MFATSRTYSVWGGPILVDPLEKIMNLKRGLVLVYLVALSSFVIAQSSVDGTWTGEVQGGRGPQTVTLTLKADGDKLTGSVGGGRGGPVTIEDGTIKGANLKFNTKQAGRGGGEPVTLNWTGTVKGDTIAFSRMVEGGQAKPVEFTLTKQK
jgi:hypothetical protein